MSIYILPDTAEFCPQEFAIQVVGNVHVNTSPLSGATQTVEFPGDRRVVQLTYGARPNSQMAALRAFWSRFRGQAHLLRLWNLAQPVPRGTLRGSPTLAAAAPQGANSINISNPLGQTLLAGDYIGVLLENGVTHTVEVVEDATSSLSMVHISPPLRRAANAGAAIYWYRPALDCLLTAPPMISHGPGAVHELGFADGFTVEAVEFIH